MRMLGYRMSGRRRYGRVWYGWYDSRLPKENSKNWGESHIVGKQEMSDPPYQMWGRKEVNDIEDQSWGVRQDEDPNKDK